MCSAQIMHKIKRIEPLRHHVDYLQDSRPFPALPIVLDPVQKPRQTFPSDPDQFPEIVHSACRAQLFYPFAAQTQQTVPIPVTIHCAQIQIVNDFRIDLHITVGIKHLAADISKDLLAPRSQPVRVAAPFILQYHIQLLHREAEFFYGHMVNVGDCQFHRLLIELRDRIRIFMAFLHDLCPHHQTELFLQIVPAPPLLVNRQLLLRHRIIRFFDCIYDALLPLPYQIIPVKQKVFVTIAAHAKSCQNAVAKLLSRKPFSSLDLAYHTKRADVPAQCLQRDPLYFPGFSDKRRKIPQIERL